MKLRSNGILSALGLLGLVLAAQSGHAQSMAPGQAAAPLPTVDLTKPGSGKVVPRSPVASAAPVVAAAPAVVPAPLTKAAPAMSKTKPTAVAKAKPTKKAPTKAVKAKPPAKPTQTATAGDR